MSFMHSPRPPSGGESKWVWLNSHKLNVWCSSTIQLNKMLTDWTKVFLSILTLTTFKLLYYYSRNLCPFNFA
jgi:hypothetical protein